MAIEIDWSIHKKVWVDQLFPNDGRMCYTCIMGTDG